MGETWPMAALKTHTLYSWGWNCMWAMRLKCDHCGTIRVGPQLVLGPPFWPSLTPHGCACRCTAWRRGGRAPAAQRCHSRWSPRHVTATVGRQDKAGSHPSTVTHSTSSPPSHSTGGPLCPSLILSLLHSQSTAGRAALLCSEPQTASTQVSTGRSPGHSRPF